MDAGGGEWERARLFARHEHAAEQLASVRQSYVDKRQAGMRHAYAERQPSVRHAYAERQPSVRHARAERQPITRHAHTAGHRTRPPA